MRSSEQRIQLDILHIIVHAAVVPLVAESQTAAGHASRDLRIAGLFFGHRDHAGHLTADLHVQLLQELNGFQIFIAAIDIRYPFAGLSSVIQIEHRGQIIDSQAVGMVSRQPEECA